MQKFLRIFFLLVVLTAEDPSPADGKVLEAKSAFGPEAPWLSPGQSVTLEGLDSRGRGTYSMELPTGGLLALEVSVEDDRIPWVEVVDNSRVLDQRLGSWLGVVPFAGQIHLLVGSVDTSVQKIQLVSHYIPFCVSRDTWGKNDPTDNGEGTEEADNEIVPLVADSDDDCLPRELVAEPFTLLEKNWALDNDAWRIGDMSNKVGQRSYRGYGRLMKLFCRRAHRLMLCPDLLRVGQVESRQFIDGLEGEFEYLVFELDRAASVRISVVGEADFQATLLDRRGRWLQADEMVSDVSSLERDLVAGYYILRLSVADDLGSRYDVLIEVVPHFT